MLTLRLKLFFAACAAAALIYAPGNAASYAHAAGGDDDEDFGDRPRHEILYEKYENAPDGSDEKEEYYRQYQQAYAEYRKEQAGKKSEKKKEIGKKSGPTEEEVNEAYEKYQKAPDGSDEKERLYEEYMKLYSQSQKKKPAGKKSDETYQKDEEKEETADVPKKPERKKRPGDGATADKNSGLADAEKRVNDSYERYRKAPEGSEEKDRYYEEYQQAYRDYQARLAESKKKKTTVADGDEDLTVSKAPDKTDGRKPGGRKTGGPDRSGGKHQSTQQSTEQTRPMIGYMQGNYLVDTPNTPVPKVSGGGGGNIFKKLFRKVEASTESTIGAQTCAALELLYGVNTDNVLNDRVNRVGNRVASVANRQDIKYRFKVLNMKDPNAFAVPGGTIYATKGLLDMVNSDSELAAVLAHEVGHQCAKHSIKAIERGMLVQVFLNKTKMGAVKDHKTALEIANVFMSLKYSRDDEYEADRYGFNYASLTGYNPYGMTTFFQKLQKLGGSQPAFMKYLSTHPDTRDRISRANDMASGFVSTHPQWKAYAPGAIK